MAEEIQAINSCPSTVCGFNSPEIDRAGFHYLLTDGTPNNEGFSITGFSKQGNAYQVRVTDGRIYGDAPRGAAYPSISGVDLIGSYLELARYGTDFYALKIRDVGTMTYPVGRRDAIETYVLEYALMSNGMPNPEWKNLCSLQRDPRDPDPEFEVASALGQPFESSVVYEGDDIDMQTKTIAPSFDRAVFNIGCAGHTIAKLHLTRNSSVGQGTSAAWRWNERQATLKLLTADYCNTGESFTVAGQRLVWQGGDVTYFRTPTTNEARWDESGAICVDYPRMLTPTSSLGASTFPDIWSSIHHVCRPRSCARLPFDELQRTIRISGNY